MLILTLIGSLCKFGMMVQFVLAALVLNAFIKRDNDNKNNGKITILIGN